MMVREQNGSLAGGLGSCGGGSSLERGNSSRLEEPLALPTFSAAAQVRVGLTLVLCVVSAACNVAVLWSGRTRRPAKASHARLLLLHLAGADLLVAVVVMPLDAAWNITLQWRAGDLACRLLMFLKLLAMYASAFITALISLDCQAAILQPLAITQAWRRNQILLSVVWLMSACLSAPQLFLFHTVTITSPQTFTQCTTHGSFPQRWHEVAYNMVGFLGLFLLPLLIMAACYIRVLLEISRHASACSHVPAQELPLRRSCNPIPRARLRLLHLSLAVVGSFVLCWTPYYLLGLWYWFWPAGMEGAVSPSLAHILFLFGLFNACLDPITYSLFTGGGWSRCCWPRGRGSQSPSPVTGSFRGSLTSIRARRWGALFLRGAAEPAPGLGSRVQRVAAADVSATQPSTKAVKCHPLPAGELQALRPGTDPEEERALMGGSGHHGKLPSLGRSTAGP